MRNDALIDLLKTTGVIIEGHFLLTSGKHSNLFLQCSQLLQYPEHAGYVGRLMAEPFQESGVQAVIGPALGGIILAYEIARALGTRALYAEPYEGRMILRRGFSINRQEKILVVEDAVTTGGSVQKVLDLMYELGAYPVGVSVMIDRTAGQLNFDLPTESMLAMEIESYKPADCPLCRAGKPLTKPKGL